MMSSSRNPSPQAADGRSGEDKRPVTKTRLRRGEVPRDKSLAARSVQDSDFPPELADAPEDLICHLADEDLPAEAD